MSLIHQKLDLKPGVQLQEDLRHTIGYIGELLSEAQ